MLPQQLNLVCRDLDATIAWYRLLGLDVPDDSVWRTGSGAHHVELRFDNGLELAFDSDALAARYNAGFDAAARPAPGRVVVGFRVAAADDVDAACARLTAAGHALAEPPHYTFWGARYAIAIDPDGHHVGIMGPSEADRRSAPPDI